MPPRPFAFYCRRRHAVRQRSAKLLAELLASRPGFTLTRIMMAICLSQRAALCGPAQRALKALSAPHLQSRVIGASGRRISAQAGPSGTGGLNESGREPATAGAADRFRPDQLCAGRWWRRKGTSICLQLFRQQHFFLLCLPIFASETWHCT